MDILRAKPEDLEQILSVQHLAYQSQARLNNDFSIPALVETLEEIKRDFPLYVVLKAVDEGRIVGSVRGRIDGGTCLVGRLFVHPDYQGKGLGIRLLTEIEAACPISRYELFTSDKSVNNIRLYERLGYVRFGESDVPAGYKFIFMEKQRPTAE